MPAKPKALKVVVKVDNNIKTLYGAEIVKLEHAQNAGAHAWDDRYEAIGAILEHEPPLYLAGGYSNDRDFIAKVVKEDKSSVYRNVRVAKYASPDEIEKYTPSRIDLAISLVELKNGGPLKARTPINFEKLRFSFTADKKVVTKSFTDMSVEELRAAVAHVKGRQATSKKASPVAQAIGALLKRASVKATFTLSKKQLVLHVPLADVAKAGAALSKFVAPK